MTVQLYYAVASPPARAVLLTLKTLNIPHELRVIDFLKGDHRTEEYLQMNPQHTVPTLVDDGFVVLDSHAINAYLVGKYGKDDQLYPTDVKARSIVDHRLHLDSGVLFPVIKHMAKSIFELKTITSVTPEILSSFEDAYDTVEKFLSSTEHDYIAGNQITIADFSVITTLGNMLIFMTVKKEKHPVLAEYIDRCYANIPTCRELNEVGIEAYHGYLKIFGFQLPASL